MTQRAKPHQWLEKPGVREALVSGKSLAQIAALAGVTRQAVGLYKRKHFQPALQTAVKARAYDRMTSGFDASTDEVAQSGRLATSLLAANPLIERSDLLWKEAWDSVLDVKRAVTTLTDAEGNERIRGRDFSGVAPILSAAVRTLELYGRASGYLLEDTGPPTVLIVSAPGGNVTIGAGPVAPRETELPASSGMLELETDDTPTRRR
jgi:hypothetical protein